MTSVVIKGTEYPLTNEPIHGIVRYVKKTQKSISMKFLLQYSEKLTELQDIPVEEAMRIIAKDDPDGMAEYNQEMEDFIETAAISLATGKIWTIDDFFDVKDSEYKNILSNCKEAIGGGVLDFFGIYQSNMNFKEKEMIENIQNQKPLEVSSIPQQKGRSKRGKGV